MPTYEYACANCGHQWEEIQKISEPAVESCPKCKEMSARRQISGGTFILKGGGWYSDLYSSTKPSTKSEGSTSGGESKSETKTETKPEPKSGGSGDTKAA